MTNEDENEVFLNKVVESWVGFVNQFRQYSMEMDINDVNERYKSATKILNDSVQEVRKEVVENGSMRGGDNGAHGFIAEILQKGYDNASSAMNGEELTTVWVNGNKAADLIRGDCQVQVKFASSGGQFSLDAIERFLEKYPYFRGDKYKYMIPSDDYDALMRILDMTEEQAKNLSKSEDGFTYTKWKNIHEKFESGGLDRDSIISSHYARHDVDVDVYETHVSYDKKAFKKEATAQKEVAKQKGAASVGECASVTVTAGAFEALSVFVALVNKFHAEGKTLKDLSEDDWAYLAKETGFGFLKGGSRGGLLYVLTNIFSSSPVLKGVAAAGMTQAGQALAGMMVTASFEIAHQTHSLRSGEISEELYFENVALACAEAGAVLLGTLAGGVVAPSVLGPLVGSAIGSVIYKVAVNELNEYEIELLKKYIDEQLCLQESLDSELNDLIDALNQEMDIYLDMVNIAFSKDIFQSYKGSVLLAGMVGVDEREILDSAEKIDSYFLR